MKLAILLSVIVFLSLVRSSAIAAQEPDSRLIEVRRQHSNELVEPDYENSPHYCLIVFGEDLKRKVWLVLDGHETLYADLNGDRDFADTGEKIGVSKSIAHLDPTTKSLNYFKIDNLVLDQKTFIVVGVPNLDFEPSTEDEKKRIEQERKAGTIAGLLNVASEIRHQLTFSPSKTDSQVSWIDGPVTVTTSHEVNRTDWAVNKLDRNGRPSRVPFIVLFVTFGLPAETSKSYCFYPALKYPANKFPVAKFKFDSVTTTVQLTPKVTGWTGSTRIPQTESNECVEVRISFDEWKDENIEPRTFKLNIAH